MTEEVKKYAEKRILDSNIRMVPGHYPVFESKEQVDLFIKMRDMAFYKKESHDSADLTEVDAEEYRSLLERLKRNKENVSPELLETKYKKSYDQLKEKIQAMTKGIFQDVVLSGLQIERAKADQRYIEINTAIRESGIMKKASQAAFIQQDADLVLEYAGQLREIVHQVAKGCEKNAS
ncbi:hypothetical protein [Lacrimispora sp.]|uniref:hypothetical protein n=1 Tax=Lacrimispora sp. TaxID=2719234 RepID=UPI0029E31777|nr:hypothetical protein [Lacrimispora sp.]